MQLQDTKLRGKEHWEQLNRTPIENVKYGIIMASQYKYIKIYKSCFDHFEIWNNPCIPRYRRVLCQEDNGDHWEEVIFRNWVGSACVTREISKEDAKTGRSLCIEDWKQADAAVNQIHPTTLCWSTS